MSKTFMFCLHCGTENSPDSKFCKECGRVVSKRRRTTVIGSRKLSHHIAEDINVSAIENPQIKRLLDMAFWHNQTGNIPAAILACEAALIIDPESTTALSLLGCLYEKQGDVQKAIDAFERVVEINPDSEADQDKLAALKRGEYIKPFLQPIKYRWLPPALVGLLRNSNVARVGIAAAAALVLFLFGMLMLRPQSPVGTPADRQTKPTAAIVSPASSDAGAPSISSGQAPAQAPAQAVRNPAAGFTPDYSPEPAVSAPTNEYAADATPAIPPITTAAASDPSAPSLGAVKPISPTQTEISNAVKVEHGAPFPQHTVVVGSSGVGSTEVAPASDLNTDSTGATTPQSDAPPPPPEHISIHVIGRNPAAPVNVLPTNANESLVNGGASSTVSRGYQLQSKALSYQRQGKFQFAEQLYNQAIAAYKREIAAGHSSSEAQRGIAASRTGVQICQQSE